MTRFLATLIAVAVLGAAAVTHAVPEQTRERKLQQAIDLIESQGDFGGAMALLEDVAKSEDRGLAARALLYLGQVQERLGQAQATKTYQRIVNEFATPRDVAVEAQARLAAIGGASSSASTEPRLICEQCGGVGYVSTDGRWMVASTRDTGSDIAIRDIRTGVVKPLLAKTDTLSAAQGGEQTYWPLLSDDSRQVAFAFVPAGPRSGKIPSTQLRIMPNQPAASHRVLVDNPEISYTVPVGWLQNRSLLTLMMSPDQTWRLTWVDTANGDITPLKSLDWRVGEMARSVSLSPDGRYIAYSALAINPKAPGRVESNDRRIYLLASDRSSEVALTRGTGVSNSPVWTPDGSHVLYTSDLSGTTDLWAVGVSGGKATGEPKLLKKNIGDVVSLGMTKSGAYHYFESRTGVYRASFARVTANDRGGGTSTESIVGIRPTWSPDGRSIAVSRSRPGVAGEFDVVVRSLETGVERVYRNDGLGQTPLSVWLPDGRALLKLVREGAQSWWYRLELDTGEFHKLVAHGNEGNTDGHFFAPSIRALSFDGRTMYFGASRPTEPNFIGRLDSIGALDLVTGQRRIVFTLPGTDDTLPFVIQGLTIAISPDGQTLAIAYFGKTPGTTRLARVDVTGHNYRELTTPFKNDQLTNTLAWSRDGRSIYFVSRDVGNKDRLMRVPAEGGPSEFTGVQIDGLNDFDLSPDATQIVFGPVSPEGAAMMHWTLDVTSLLRRRR